MLLNICASSQDGKIMSLYVVPDEVNEINEFNIILSLNNSYSNMSGDSLYQNKLTNSDNLPRYVTLMNDNMSVQSTTLALSNGSHPDRDHVTDDSFKIGMNHPQSSSVNLLIVTY